MHHRSSSSYINHFIVHFISISLLLDEPPFEVMMIVNARPYDVRPTILFSDSSALLFDEDLKLNFTYFHWDLRYFQGDLNMARMLSVPMTKARMEEALRNETVHDSDHSKSFNEAVVDDLNNEEEHVECRTQRAQAMKKLQMNPNSGNYVPTCTGENDLLYDRVQCHRSSQFCWCVNPETGAPIKGLSKYNGKPNCSRKSERRNREIKGEILIIDSGCVGKKKMKFYQRLFTTLLSEWISAIGSDANEDTNVTKEQAVRWKFSRLDTNQNNRLERREWKPYREELKRWNKLHKCGRNFIRFCDSNGDKRLTMDEWINCTLSGESQQFIVSPIAHQCYPLENSNKRNFTKHERQSRIIGLIKNFKRIFHLFIFTLV
ncbi:unnamed protein product [Anisakis simplex]|uniref:Thyroglobulin type-1 domain-containing protein n=1 Tax=Anisakis simplex TaxID=6269 RepID=A0A0M3K8X7_ANISI|nr:unnamed protein product [Anisakis simplex]